MHSFFATKSARVKRSNGRDMKLGEALVSVKLPSFFKTLQREDLGEVVIVTKGWSHHSETLPNQRHTPEGHLQLQNGPLPEQGPGSREETKPKLNITSKMSKK